MTDWLVQRFVKNPEDIDDEKTRFSYGVLSSLAGIACNIFLFLLKLISGLVMNSISVMSDGFNNLSDCMSCIITLFSYKLAAKPADKEHPFGHGRMEYVSSFIVTIIIFIVVFQLLVDSINKIINPEPVTFNLILFVLLAASILVKIWMSRFNTVLGNKIDNISMLTAAQDSKNDVYVTLISLVAMLLAAFTKGFPFDGVAGVLLSIFLFYQGFQMAMGIINKLLGTPADHKLVQKITKQILSHPEIMGVHDVMIHDYGPGVKIGSAHAEVDGSMDIMVAHDVIDQAEQEVQENCHVMMTLHMDPLNLSDPTILHYRTIVLRILHQIDPHLSMHDFRTVTGDTHTNLIFDVLIPFDCKLEGEQIKKLIDKELAKETIKFYTVITFDRGYVSYEDSDE